MQPRILLARLRALIRRSNGSREGEARDPDIVSFGGLRINKGDRVSSGKIPWSICRIPNLSFLMILAESPGKVLSRDDILKKCGYRI